MNIFESVAKEFCDTLNVHILFNIICEFRILLNVIKTYVSYSVTLYTLYTSYRLTVVMDSRGHLPIFDGSAIETFDDWLAIIKYSIISQHGREMKSFIEGVTATDANEDINFKLWAGISPLLRGDALEVSKSCDIGDGLRLLALLENRFGMKDSIAYNRRKPLVKMGSRREAIRDS